MFKYKEFWFAFVLLALSILYCFLLSSINDVGQGMVRIMHSEAQNRGITDKAIYTSQTHDLFLRVGSSLAFFIVGLVLEIHWLLRRLRGHSKPKASVIVFVLAIIPFGFLVGRILLNIYKMGKIS
jgi:hypothetical protein